MLINVRLINSWAQLSHLFDFQLGSILADFAV